MRIAVLALGLWPPRGRVASPMTRSRSISSIRLLRGYSSIAGVSGAELRFEADSVRQLLVPEILLSMKHGVQMDVGHSAAFLPLHLTKGCCAFPICTLS